MSDWEKKDLWRRSGDGFLVEVSRHDAHSDLHVGPHRWCVYAYVYPSHPHFKAFDGTEDMWQPATGALPLHGGCTFLRAHRNAAGVITSWQVGADYNHLYDERFTRHATPEQAREVFADAEELFRWLSVGAPVEMATVTSEHDADGREVSP